MLDLPHTRRNACPPPSPGERACSSVADPTARASSAAASCCGPERERGQCIAQQAPPESCCPQHSASGPCSDDLALEWLGGAAAASAAPTPFGDGHASEVRATTTRSRRPSLLSPPPPQRIARIIERSEELLHQPPGHSVRAVLPPSQLALLTQRHSDATTDQVRIASHVLVRLVELVGLLRVTRRWRSC